MVTQKVLTYRDYELGDERRILGLFAEVFHREMSPAFWQWRYVEGPYGHGIIRVAMDGDKMVGHFGVIPMKVQFKGNIYPVIFPMTAMTHPEYGGRGIFTRLMSEIYESARRQGFPLVYGFFNQNSYYANVKFGYHDVIKMNPLKKRLSFTESDGHMADNIASVDVFDTAISQLWNRVKKDYVAVVPRTSEFLNWRFVKAPGVDYARFAYQDAAGDIFGYVVLKIYTEGKIVRGHIVDLMTIPDENVAKALVRKSYDYFKAHQVPDVSCWMMEGTSYSRILEEEGFVRHPGMSNFAVMVLDKGNPGLLPAENASSWFLTMGDSDVY